MRSDNTCPKCGCEKIYEVQPRQTYCDAGGTLRDLTLTGASVATGEKGLFGEKTEQVMVGAEALVCSACGFTEWWVPKRALAKLQRLVGTDAVRVRLRKRASPPADE